MSQEYNDVDVITSALKTLKIQMEIDNWTHDVVVRKEGKIVKDADSLYLDVVRLAQDMRFNSKYLTKTFISDLIKANAVYKDNVLEFFNNEKWDGKSRLTQIKRSLCFDDSDMWKFRLWLRQGAALVFNKGESTDVQRNFMLILFSAKQGNGKSTLAKKLSIGTNSFGDSTIDLKSKESVRRAYESWIYEYPELSSMFRKADVNMLKTFITASAQNFRLPYDKFFTKYPTRTSIIGTTNDEEIFIDDTGSRRFLVVKANWCRDDWTNINSVDWRQVWLQALEEYRKGMPICMTGEEQEANDKQNENFSYTNAATYKLMDYVGNKEEISDAICEIKLVDIIQYLTNQRMEPSTKMIFSTMKKLGYITKKTKLSCKFIKPIAHAKSVKLEKSAVRSVQD
jgi:predicted P-loop ATPase